MKRKKKFEKSIADRLSVGQTVNVRMAHEYRKDRGWFNYSNHEGEFVVECITPEEVRCRSNKHDTLGLSITQKYLDEGYIKISF